VITTSVLEGKADVDVAPKGAPLDEEKDVGVSPMSKIFAIGAVYFPELFEDIEALDHASDLYIGWTFEAAKSHLADPDKAFPKDTSDYAGKHFALLKRLRNMAVDGVY
jgi:hypothetical protein